MKTTGINKTVYRSDVISALDSFTSIRNVLAWEMFQDGQVRNYDGVIGDLKRLYPNIDFDSVTENVDPESIAEDEDVIYSIVDDILNKLIESGISKDNFNYAIWACDDPENVVNTYGVDIDDVSAYKITDGILLQDLGYEGQLYGVAEYPEEEWDVIESGLNGVNDVSGIPSKIPHISKENKKIETGNVNKTDNHDTLNVQDTNDFNAMADIATKILYDTIRQSPNLSITVNQLKFIYTSFLIKYLDDETITQSDLEEKLKEYNSKLSPEIVSAIVSAFFLKRKKRTEDGEEYYEISNSFQGGNMETREDYKDYYLEQLIENYGDMTERDYNSAQKFCYDEEWNLGEVGNMAEAIDGLGDAWTEYQKQYKEGFEIMNNVTLSNKNITSSGRWVVKTNEDQMDYIGNFFEGLPSCPQYVDWGYNEEKYAKAVNDDIFGWMYEDSDFSEADKKKITRNFLKLYKDYYNNGEPKDDLNTYYFEGEGPKDPRLIEWLHSVLSDKELNVPFTTWHYVESSKKNIKSSKAEELEMFENESVYGNESEFNDFKKNHPDFTITYLDWKKYLNGYEDDVQYEFEDENGNMYTWDMIKTEIDNWVDSGDFEEQNGELPEYFEKDGTPKYKKIYDDFWDIGSNGVMEYIGSSRRNNMVKSEYDYANSPVTKYVNAQRTIVDFIKKYNYQNRNYEFAQGLKGADNVNLFPMNVPADDFTKDRDYLEAVSVIEDFTGKPFDLEEFKRENARYINSSRRNNMKKTIKSVYTLGRNEIDEFEQTSPDLGVKFDEPLLIVHDYGYIYNHEGFEKYINEITQLYPDNWEDANEAYHTDSIEEFIDMCESDWFRHDFGGAFDFYREGLKQMAESTISEVPADGQPFSIKNGFAFKLLGENETDFDVENPYWVDDYSLQRIDGFFCQINPSVGNQFDVVIDPDYFNVPEGETVVTSSRKPIKSSKWVEDVADKKGITFEQVLEVFKDNGYGEDEADDFWNSKWNDVSDAFGEDGIAGLDELFGIEIETEDDDIYEDDKDVDYDKYHLDRGEVKTEELRKELMNEGYSKEEIDYVFHDHRFFGGDYLDKYWQDRLRRELEFRKGKSVTSARKSIKSSSMIYKENEMPSVMKDRIYWEIYYYNEGDNKELGTQNRYDSVRGMSFTQAKRRAKQLMRDYNCDTACMQTTGGNGVIIKNDSIGDKNMKIQSKRLIKSGTSNFGSNDDIFGYSFPLVTYVAENYYYDEETDSETEERDYDTDDWEYRDAIEDAKALADEMNIPQYDDYSEPYLCYEPFMIKFRDGYYEGLWIEVKEGTDETNYDSDGEYTGEWVPFTEEQMNKYADKLNEYFNKLCSDYGWQKLGVIARFSNGETWYSKISNSRKPVTSGLTFRQAVQDFKAAGHWNDYYEMQQDWEAYKDGLERDGVISEKTRSTWGNPCTPEGFKKWNK